MLAANDDWLDAEEDLRDLEGFYDADKGQILTWRRMLASLAAIKDNRDKLLEDAKAAPALRELDTIKALPRPYGQISKIDSLLGSIEQANEALAAEKRQHALHKIDEKISAVQQGLDQLQAPDDVCNQALHKLQQLRQKVAAETSISQIFYLQGQAGTLLDKAMDVLASYQDKLSASKPVPPPKPAPDTTGGHMGGSTAKPAVVNQPTATYTIKPSKTVKAANFTAGQLYLESEADVDAYLARLRAELMGIVNAGQRARVE